MYSVVNETRGADLWLVDRDGQDARMLVNCEADLCTVPAWSPQGGRIAFSREPAGLSPGAPNGPPRVWTVDLASGQAASLYQSSQVLGYGPTWSPDGRRLAFFDGSAQSIRLLDVGTGQEMLINTLMGTVGSWSPDGEWLAVSARTRQGGPGKQIWLMKPDCTQWQPVTNGPGYTYGGYRWDVTGQALVFQRFELNKSFATPEVVM